MLLTLVPMYKITKLFVAFFVGFCLVSFIPANNATREMRLASVGAPGLNAFYEDVVHKATVLFAHPNSLPSLEIQSSRTPDESNDSHSTERPKALPNINADITSQNFGPRNSTLGFSSITALTSKASTWRSEGLVRAANLTNLTIQALSEPERAPEEINAFNASHRAYISRGAIQAWMSHVRALESFLASNDSSTLILEDDADWDINIKSQMRDLSVLLQAHYKANPESYPADSREFAEYPYGYDSWDLMWLGHCGGAFNFSLGQPGNSTLPYHDASLLDLNKLVTSEDTPPIDPFFRYVYLPSAKPTPICTFAYAVNRRSAEKILTEVKREDLYEDAFDVRLYVLCRWGQLNCMSVFPELFHHQQWSDQGRGSLIKAVDQEPQHVNDAHGNNEQGIVAMEGGPQDQNNEGRMSGESTEGMEYSRWTENIKYSARCNSELTGEPERHPQKVERSMRIRRRSNKSENGAEPEQEWKMCLDRKRFQKGG